MSRNRLLPQKCCRRLLRLAVRASTKKKAKLASKSAAKSVTKSASKMSVAKQALRQWGKIAKVQIVNAKTQLVNAKSVAKSDEAANHASKELTEIVRLAMTPSHLGGLPSSDEENSSVGSSPTSNSPTSTTGQSSTSCGSPNSLRLQLVRRPLTHAHGQRPCAAVV